MIVNVAEPSGADGVEINCRDNPVLPPLGTVTDTGARVTPETEVCSVGVTKASLLPMFLTYIVFERFSPVGKILQVRGGVNGIVQAGSA